MKDPKSPQPETLPPFPSTRGFGIEIECFLPSPATAGQFQKGMAHRGVPILGAPVTATGGQWKAESDGSLMYAPAGYDSVEIVSPVLSGIDGLIDVLSFIDYLNEINVKTNSTCGIHIHVGCKDYTPTQRQMFVDTFKQYERGFMAFNGPLTTSRLNNPYCQLSRSWLTHDALHVVNATYPSERYQTLNWQKFDKQGTFEFRLFSGAMIHKTEALMGALLTCIMFADAVATGTLTGPTVGTADGIMTELMGRIGALTPGLGDELLGELIPWGQQARASL